MSVSHSTLFTPAGLLALVAMLTALAYLAGVPRWRGCGAVRMNTITIAGHTREMCVVLMTAYYLEELVRKGRLEGVAFRLTEKSKPLCEQLKREGFEFNPGEMESALDVLHSAAIEPTTEVA